MALGRIFSVSRSAEDEVECLLLVIDKITHDMVNAENDLAISNVRSQETARLK